jgi:hypothetical protein
LRKEKVSTHFHLNDAERQKLLNQWICRQIKTWPLQLPRLRSERLSQRS